MQATFPEIKAQQDIITKVIKEEEESFLRTLSKGIQRLSEYRRNKLIESIHNYLIENNIESSNNWIMNESQHKPDLFLPNLQLGIDIHDSSDLGGHKQVKSKTPYQTEPEFYHLRLNLEQIEKQSQILDKLSSIKNGDNIFRDFKYNLFVSREFAFELYDTFGFPIDLTKLIVEELRGKVDEVGFGIELQKQKERSRAATKIEAADWIELREDDVEEFIGYDYTEADIYITKYRKVAAKGEEFYQLVFNLTPFYPEGGGQVGDSGFIEFKEEKIEIFDTKKENNLIVHFSKEIPQDVNAQFIAVVDEEVRGLTARNHTATHLMHQALREVLGTHVEQKGSLVNSEYLRFDFSHFQKVTDEELAKIEALVNSRIQEKFELNEYRAIPIKKAEEKGAMMLFGEKYGDVVRMIEFGESRELCGGIHVSSTSEIELFKINSEGSVASGIRRIEASTSQRAAWILKNKVEIISVYERLLPKLIDANIFNELVQIKLDLISEYKKVIGASNHIEFESVVNRSDLENINRAITDLTRFKLPKNIIDALTAKKKELSKAGKQDNKEQTKLIRETLLNKIEVVDGVNVIAQKIDLDDSAAIKDLAFQLKAQVENLFLVLGAEVNEKPNLTIVVADNLVTEKELHAGNIIREAAKEMQGGGGGQPFFATAGGKNVAGIEVAIAKAKSFLK